jgi:ATPase subunit of ABC transporter with duplicated ATPase domains
MSKKEIKHNNKSINSFEINANISNKKKELSNNLTTLYSDTIEIEINGKKIINTSDLAINATIKYFVMGNNGCGKTTLLKYVYEKIKDKIDILMIEQDIDISDNSLTIENFILYADKDLYENYKIMKELELKEELNDSENNLYNNAAQYCYQKGWDKYEAESKRILNGLGFLNKDLNIKILSGGWRMRLALGKALLRQPDVLILDEPTNHLDLNAVIWLTDYLKGYKKTLIVITHQVAFVNSLADVIWYIGNPELKNNNSNSLYTIQGTYDKLLKFIDNTQKEAQNKYDKFQKRIEEMKKKSTPKKDIEDFIKKNNVQRPPKPYIVNITFDNVKQLSTKNIIEFRNVSFGFNSDNFIFNNIEISLDMGTRMILVGENGVGKTTFLKLASLQLQPTYGSIYYDERIRIGYYNQQIIDTLPLNLTPIEYLQTLNTQLTVSDCRAILGKLGLKKTDIIDPPMNIINNLSGGQKARVSFAKLQMSNPHLILLDEPTNHLDLESIDGLIRGINEFNGGIVIITHDIYLIENIDNANIFNVYDKNIEKFKGDFDDYCQFILNK